MAMEEEDARPKVATAPLERMDVAELEAYVASLRAEIARAEGHIASKRGHRSAADAFFRT